MNYKALLYQDALILKKSLKKCQTYQEELDLWDGLSLLSLQYIIKHDLKETSTPYGNSIDNFLLAINGKDNELLNIYPKKIEDRRLFFDWCVKKGKSNFSFFTEDEYWQQIKIDLVPFEFLNESINRIKTIINNLNNTVFGSRIDINSFGKICLRSGFERTKRQNYDNWLDELFTLLYEVSFNQSSKELGKAFFLYWDGCHLANMYAFLLEQRERAENKENIRELKIIPKNNHNLEITGECKENICYLNQTTDLAVYAYFLGQLGISQEKINLDCTKEPLVQYKKWIEELNRKYYNNQSYFKIDSVKTGVLAIANFIDNPNYPTDREKYLKILLRVKEQILQDYPTFEQSIKDSFLLYFA